MENDSDSSFNSSAEEEYDWDRFIYEEQGTAAPRAAFNQPENVPQNNFVKGHIIMAQDRKLRSDGAFVAQVDKTYKCFIRVNLVEVERKFWTICDSDIISPFCESSIRRHPDNTKTNNAWEKWVARFMEEHSNNIAPASIMETTAYYFPEENYFTVGMVLAYMDDHTFSGKLSPAIVIDVKKSGIIKLALADRGFRTEIELYYYDRRLFPIDFVEKAGVPVRSGTRWKKAGKGVPILKTPARPPRQPLRRAAGQDNVPKKKGRPPGRPKKKSMANLLDPASKPTRTYTKRVQGKSTSEMSFYPANTSTPLRLNEQMTSRTDSLYDSLYDTSFTSINTLGITNSLDVLSERVDLEATRNQEEEFQIRAAPPLHIQKNAVTPIEVAPVTRDVSTIDIENMTTCDFSMPKSTIMELQDLWVGSSSGRNCDQPIMHFPLTKMLLAVCNELCIPKINLTGSSGPYISMEVLTREIKNLPPLHFKMQFYNVLVALTKSIKASHEALDKLGYGQHSRDTFDLYVDCNGHIHRRSFPIPRDLNYACGWLKFHLKQLNADEDLITLRENH